MPSNDAVRFNIPRARSVADCNLHEAVVSAGFTSPRHAHDHAWITLILDGACQETYRGKTSRFARHDSAFHRPGEDHVVRTPDTGVWTFGIELAPSLLARCPDHHAAIETIDRLAPERLSWQAARIYREFGIDDEASNLAIEGLLLEMMAALSRSSSRPIHRGTPQWLRRVEVLIREEYHRSLSLSTLAETVDVHPSHLARRFRETYGCTLGEYLRRVRVARARRQMLDTQAPLAEIALRVGFADQSHLSRTFKRMTGMTPSQFRRTFR